MSFRWTRSKIRCLVMMYSTTNTAYQHKGLRLTQWWKVKDWGLFCRHRSWTPCHHWSDRELLCIPKYSRVKCEATGLTTNAWLKLGHATGQWNRMAEKESECCNDPVKVQTSTWLKCCGGGSGELCINECLQWPSMNCRNLAKKNGSCPDMLKP